MACCSCVSSGARSLPSLRVAGGSRAFPAASSPQWRRRALGFSNDAETRARGGVARPRTPPELARRPTFGAFPTCCQRNDSSGESAAPTQHGPSWRRSHEKGSAGTQFGNQSPTQTPTQKLTSFLVLLASITLVVLYWKVILSEIQQFLALVWAVFSTFASSLVLVLCYVLKWLGGTFVYYGGKPAAWVAAVAMTAVSMLTRYAFFVLDGLPIWKTILSVLSASAALCIAEVAGVPISTLGQPLLISALAATATILFGVSPLLFLSVLLLVALHLKIFRKERLLTAFTPAVSVLSAMASVFWFRGLLLGAFLLAALLSYRGEGDGTRSHTKVGTQDQSGAAALFQPFGLRALTFILMVVLCRRVAYNQLLLWQL